MRYGAQHCMAALTSSLAFSLVFCVITILGKTDALAGYFCTNPYAGGTEVFKTIEEIPYDDCVRRHLDFPPALDPPVVDEARQVDSPCPAVEWSLEPTEFDMLGHNINLPIRTWFELVPISKDNPYWSEEETFWKISNVIEVDFQDYQQEWPSLVREGLESLKSQFSSTHRFIPKTLTVEVLGDGALRSHFRLTYEHWWQTKLFFGDWWKERILETTSSVDIILRPQVPLDLKLKQNVSSSDIPGFMSWLSDVFTLGIARNLISSFRAEVRKIIREGLAPVLDKIEEEAKRQLKDNIIEPDEAQETLGQFEDINARFVERESHPVLVIRRNSEKSVRTNTACTVYLRNIEAARPAQ